MFKQEKREVKEYRRLTAIKLLKEGWSQDKIAEFLGVSQSSVSHWKIRFEKYQEEGLKAKKQPGKPARLNKEQKEQLMIYLDAGAGSCGFEGDFWTQKRVSRLILDKFSVVLKPRQCGDLLHQLGYRSKVPQTKSYEQDPEKVKEWKDTTLPAIKKRPTNEKP